MTDYKTNIIKSIRSEMEQSLRKCLVALEMVRDYQVGPEYEDGILRVKNNMGFTRHDSRLLTSFSIKKAKLGFLPEPLYDEIRRLMPKYARQIFDILASQGQVQVLEKGKVSLAANIFLK